MPEPTESESRGHLYNLLALYAALDKAVLKSNDPATAAIVEGFLPGTTGENQRGWSTALEGFLGEEFPSANAALSGFLSAETPPTRPQLSRLVYVLGSIAHVPGARIGVEDNELAQGLGLARPQGEPVPGSASALAFARGVTDPEIDCSRCSASGSTICTTGYPPPAKRYCSAALTKSSQASRCAMRA